MFCLCKGTVPSLCPPLLRGKQDVNVRIHLQGFIRRHGGKRAWVTHWQTGMYMARQREILGQAWVDDQRTISNRARQRVMQETRTGIKTRENRQGKARQDYNNLEGCIVSLSLGHTLYNTWR